MTPSIYSKSLALVLSLLLCSSVWGVEADPSDEIKANYTKYEYRIPMRDGVRLFTAVYVPKDISKRYPILFQRTPYSVRPYGPDQYRSNLGPSPLFSKAGYIFVYQDVRGRWMSEGNFVNMRPHLDKKNGPKDIDESTDTWDTIEWLTKNLSHHNGRVGMWGISYPGFYTSAGIIDSHPALKAASPQAPISDWFMGDDWHHNGAFFLPHMFNFMARFGYARPEPTKKFEFPFDHGTADGYDFFLRLGPLSNVNEKYFKNKIAFWNKAMEHGNYDAFWQARNLRPHLKNIKPAVLTVGGWFDAENLFGVLETYRHIETLNKGIESTLVMGPWRHGGWAREDGDKLGLVSFNSKTSQFYREKIEFPFFESHLRGDGKAKMPEAWVFETGTNHWRTYDAWPPRKSTPASLYLQAEGGLTFDEPTQTKGYDEYVSDPAKPVPFIDWIDIGMPKEYMLADQRFASRRPDVLVYQTDILEEDVTLAGPLDVELFVSTSGTASDWVVKLIDVYPNDYPNNEETPKGVDMGGFQQLVRGDILRGKFRYSFEKPEPFEPNEPTAVRFHQQDVYHTFRSGHRIMIQIQSSWFPLVDRNPQKFVDIYSAKETDFQKATQRVYRTAELPSRVKVRVLPRR